MDIDENQVWRKGCKKDNLSVGLSQKGCADRSSRMICCSWLQEFDTIARLETQSIDAYNDAHHYRPETRDEMGMETEKLVLNHQQWRSKHQTGTGSIAINYLWDHLDERHQQLVVGYTCDAISYAHSRWKKSHHDPTICRVSPIVYQLVQDFFRPSTVGCEVWAMPNRLMALFGLTRTLLTGDNTNAITGSPNQLQSIFINLNLS